jgi:8-oxo-dGTP diphosphatase
MKAPSAFQSRPCRLFSREKRVGPQSVSSNPTTTTAGALTGTPPHVPTVRGRPLATDAVVLLDGEVVVLERTTDPYEGHWVLPGGFLERGERARTACAREVREEVGLEVAPVSFVGLYDAPDRDERGTVSAAYLCRPTADDPAPEPREEARRVRIVDPDALPEMGFDHADIVADATTP